MFMMKKYLLWALGAVVILSSGCIREEIGSDNMAFGRREKKSYKPLRNYHLELVQTGNGQLFAGEGGIVTFALINRGNKNVLIEEWYVNEEDNVNIICQNWLPGMTGYDSNAWVKLETVPRQPAWRYPLTLAPGNRIFVNKKLPFVDSLNITPGSERRYFIKAELNLTSVKVESKVGTVSVRNRLDKRQKPVKTAPSRHFGR